MFRAIDYLLFFFFFQAEDGIRDIGVTGVQTCALPIYDTTFVSNKAAQVAEELSCKHGLTIANEIRAEKRYQKPKANQAREASREKLRRSEERRVGKECRSRWSPYH